MTLAAETDGLPNPARRWAVASIALAIGMTVLDTSIANVALPVIARRMIEGRPYRSVEEWERVKDRARDDSQAEAWRRIRQMAETCRKDRDLYLKFIGN